MIYGMSERSTQITIGGQTYQVTDLSEEIQHLVLMLDMTSDQLTAARLEVLKCESAIDAIRAALIAALRTTE